MIKLIDFYADWCGPCNRLKPLLQEIELERDILIEYVDIQNDLNRVEANNITSLPTIIFEKEGKEFGRLNGSCSKQAILSMIDS